MKDKELPSKFTLGAVEWSIVIDNEKMDDQSAYGTSDYCKAQIIIQTKSNKHRRPKLAVEQTLYHEVTHAILDTMREYELSNNEKFVQNFSLLMHQYEVTKK